MLFPLLAVLLALPAAWLLLQPGFVATRAGGDSPFLLVRLHQMLAGLADGFPVRWMPDAAYGLSYPFWDFYAPLPYYLAALFARLGLGIVAPLKLTQLLGFLVAAAAMYALAYDVWRSRAAGLLAAVAYTYAPFHLVNVYVRGDSLGEFWAFAFYPLVWLAARRVARAPGPAAVAGLALAYAGLTLSHNISALIFSPFLALYILGVWLDRGADGRGWRPLAVAFGGIALGLAASAWFWYPALAERGLVQLEVNLTGFFSYTGHFRGANLVQAAALFDYDPTNGAAFVVGLAQAAAIVAGIVAALSWPFGRRWEVGAILLTLATAVFAITPLSQPLWDHLPLLPFAQFPWRFLSIVAFAGALISAALPARLPTAGTVWAATAVVGGALMVAGLVRLDVGRIPVADSEVTAERVALYETFTGNVGTTIRAEYLPATVNPRPYITAPLMRPGESPAAVVQAGEATATLEARHRWRVAVASETAEVAFPLLAFAGRAAWLDGQPTGVTAANGLGYSMLRVPRGEHVVELGEGRTGPRGVAEAVSLAALVLIGALLLLDRRWLWLLPVLLVGLAALWLAGLALRPAEPAPVALRTETADFIRLPWLHRNPDGVGFANGARLAGYRLDGVTDAPAPGLPSDANAEGRAALGVGVRAGETLTTTLTWDTPAGWQVDVALVSPAEHLFGISWQVANERVPLAPTTAHHLAIPAETTPGLYWLRVRLQADGNDEVGPVDAEGRFRGRLYLLPVYVLPPSAAPPPATPRYRLNDAVSLTDVQIEPRRRDLNVDLTWRTDAPLSDNYVVSLRLVDEAGQTVATSDQPPGYGFFPTSAWQVGQPVYDRRRLALPDTVTPGVYRLEIVMYHRPTLAEVGRATVDGVRVER
ncbi:MAG: hypothetical protein KIS91_08755 [Anaerolineae bacterium]|nr:hypothetical protein [Anaerolineae bacterium]